MPTTGVLWTTTSFELPLQHNSVRHYGEQRESRRKNDGEHAPIKTIARKNIVRKMSQIYADMTTAPFRILHGGKFSTNNSVKSQKRFRWLGTVVTSHTASNRQAYTPVMSMLQKPVQSTHCTSCNQPAHTNAIMLFAVKCSLYVVGPFLCRILHKSWSIGVKM